MTTLWLKIVLDKTEAPWAKQLTESPTELAFKYASLIFWPCTRGHTVEEWNALN